MAAIKCFMTTPAYSRVAHGRELLLKNSSAKGHSQTADMSLREGDTARLVLTSEEAIKTGVLLGA